VNKNLSPLLGIIEGFFGRSWSWQERSDYAAFLASHGYNYYIYAPKSDAFLRKKWQVPWPAETLISLQQLRTTYRQQNLAFGVGLSPHEIYLDNSRDNRARLTSKIKELNQLQPDILCLLFDDMRGDLPQLAKIQTEFMQQVAEHSHAQRIIFCPTYYTTDPVLEKVFGTRPENYWEYLGKHLDQHIDIFWTGPKVCSTDYPSEHLQWITELLQRKPFLWDNYPVNDGAIKSNLLQLRAFSKSHGQLQTLTAGHAVNPMNQARLSQIPLSTLPRAYRESGIYNPDQAFIDACNQLCEPQLAGYIIEDIAHFQDEGLRQLTIDQRIILRKKYQEFSGSPYAQEILAWLNDEYQFDPACLTE
jgi:hyaluronoglucosaminidase